MPYSTTETDQYGTPVWYDDAPTYAPFDPYDPPSPTPNLDPNDPPTLNLDPNDPLPPSSPGSEEHVFDPTYGGTLPLTGGTIDTSGITSALKSLFGDGKGGWDIAKLATLGGGLAGLLGLNKSSSTPTGYQGSIPKYTATRNMVTAPDPNRRPGAGGTRYGGDVTFTPRSSSTTPSTEQALTSAMGETGSVTPGGGTTTGGIAGGGSGSKMVAKDDPFFQSPEYKDFQKSQEGMMGTMDMYESPYFGSVGSGSVGRAMDEAYKKYKSQTAPITGGYEPQPFTGTDSGRPRDIFKIVENAGQKPADTGDGVVPKEFSLVDLPVVTQPKGLTPDSPFGIQDIMKMISQRPANVSSTTKPANGSFGDTPEIMQAAVMPNQGVVSAAHNMAAGGLAGLAKGRYLQGETDGMADKIPARIGKDQPAALSHGEFVIPADVVSHLGNGNSDAGAKKLYGMMDKIRQARTGTKKQGKQINPDKFMPGGLAKAYAQGGTVQHYQTGGVTGAGSAANAGVTGTESNLSNWVGPYVTDMLGKGQALSEMPYQEYGGPLTAGASNLQNKVFTGLQNVNFPGNLGQSFTSSGAPTMGADGQPTGGGTSPASQYMNPYLQSVLNPQLAELRRQNQITNMGANAKLTSAGAFGGGRQAIMNAENNRNLMQEMNKTVGQGYANAYDKAMGQFNTEQAQGIGLANLMANQGSIQRGIDAEGIAADKAAFEEARANPYKMVQFQQSLLSGLPLAAQQINSAQPDALTTAAQGAVTVNKLLEALGLVKKS